MLALSAWLALVASLNHTWAAPGPIGTDFTYQGQLTDTNGPVTGLYDFRFTAFSNPDPQGLGFLGQFPANGLGVTVGVTNGFFSVPIDFGAIFLGERVWMKIEVKPSGTTLDFSALLPFQQLTPTPYAIFAENAGNAVSIGGVTPPPGGFWGTSGNNVTPDAKLGTTDAQPLIFIVNGHEAQRFEPTGDTPNVVGGFSGNSVGVALYGATIGGGGSVLGWGNFPTQPNVINGNGYYATISGGYNNDVAGYGGVIGGGSVNLASGDFSVVAGGQFNTNTGHFAAIGGGTQNTCYNDEDTIGGGFQNTCAGNQSTIGGGIFNTCDFPYATIGGGSLNQASYYATVPGGHQNVASGTLSFAAGNRAKATQPGMFVWADSLDQDFDPAMGGFMDNSFDVRATGGSVWLTSATTKGPYFFPGDLAWRSSCDRNLKENFKPVEPRAVLEKLLRMPITEWNSKAQCADVRHLGPTAQDFHAAFGLGGQDDKGISNIDEDGVALVAIQGLNQKLEAESAELDRKLAKIDELQSRLDQLEKLVRHLDHNPSH